MGKDKVKSEEQTCAAVLLDAVNQASEKVARLHIAFLALCTYILVTVFSTSDLNLLIGKVIRLPVVEVDVPIIGFYLVAPFLVLLGHFNLLLQLQLLSQKLFAFHEAACKLPEEINKILYDQLHTFPYTYYLIGRTAPLVRSFIAVLVTTTVLLLPLLTMLMLHARFLAYQSDFITAAQWVAILMEVAGIAMLWPMIMDKHGSWISYMSGIWPFLKSQWIRCLWVLCGLGILSWMFFGEQAPVVADDRIVFNGVRLSGNASLIWLALTTIALLISHGRLWFTSKQDVAFCPSIHRSHLGFPGFLTTVLIGMVFPLLLIVGEEPAGNAVLFGGEVQNDHPVSYATIWLGRLHYLDLSEQNFYDKLATPEITVALYSADRSKAAAAETALRGIDLHGRNLRYANLRSANLFKADLRRAQLQGALLDGAVLQRANLSYANLQNARLRGASLSWTTLWRAQLQGADLSSAGLQEASLGSAELQGAILTGADLRMADLSFAHLQGADLSNAQLPWASLAQANLQGAHLDYAGLQLANLTYARLQGVTLTGASLAGAMLGGASLYSSHTLHKPIMVGIDARGLQWRPLTEEERRQLEEGASQWQWAGGNEQKTQFDAAIGAASKPGLPPPPITSCLQNELTQIQCQQIFSYEHFRAFLFPTMEQFVCQDPRFLPKLLDDLRGIGIHYRIDDGFPLLHGLPCVSIIGLDARRLIENVCSLPVQYLKQTGSPSFHSQNKIESENEGLLIDISRPEMPPLIGK